MNARIPILMALTLALPHAASAADGFYYGLSLSYGVANSSYPGAGNDGSQTPLPGLGLTLGYRLDAGKTFFGGEIDSDFSIGGGFTNTQTGLDCDTLATGGYWCDHNSTVRLRGMVGTALGPGTEAFGSLGVAAMNGESAIFFNSQDNVMSTGLTIGAGVQRQLDSGRTLRIEMIYDKSLMSNEPQGTDPSYDALTAKVGLMF